MGLKVRTVLADANSCMHVLVSARTADRFVSRPSLLVARARSG